MPLPRRHYKAPPVVEAVAEFRFVGGSWDQTVPGLFYERVKDGFPEKEQLALVETVATVGADGPQQSVVPVERLRLRREDRRAILSLSPHYLSVSRLEPYESWEEFEPIISEALRTYQEVAEPEGIQRIGLRYLNHIALEMAEGGIDLDKYFDFFPHVGQHLPQWHQSFICGVQIPFEDERDLAKVQLADQPAPEGAAAFLLDIDYFVNRAGAVPFDAVAQWLAAAHLTAGQIFEGCITDELRHIFGEKAN